MLAFVVPAVASPEPETARRLLLGMWVCVALLAVFGLAWILTRSAEHLPESRQPSIVAHADSGGRVTMNRPKTWGYDEVARAERDGSVEINDGKHHR